MLRKIVTSAFAAIIAATMLTGTGMTVSAAQPGEVTAVTSEQGSVSEDLIYYNLSNEDLVQTVGGVTFKVRNDYAHPYVRYSDFHGKDYNRILVVDMTIINNTKTAFNYTAYTEAYDANGTQLINALPMAASEFGTVAPGKTATITSQFLLKKSNLVSNFYFKYNHMDYSAQYLADMNSYSNGLMTAAQIAAKYVPTQVTFAVTNPKQ